MTVKEIDAEIEQLEGVLFFNYTDGKDYADTAKKLDELYALRQAQK